MQDNFDNENIFLIGCTHVYHENIIKYCNRPFKNATEMSDEMFKRHNVTVDGSALYINLGDFCFGNANKWKEAMSHLVYREAWLIQGNHDKEHQQDILGSGFSKIFRKFWLNYHGYNILLTHKPCITDEMLKNIKIGNPDPGYDINKSYLTISESEYEKMNLNIHAHIHNNKREQLDATGKHFNVSADMVNFTPMNLDTIIEQLFNVRVL